VRTVIARALGTERFAAPRAHVAADRRGARMPVRTLRERGLRRTRPLTIGAPGGAAALELAARRRR